MSETLAKLPSNFEYRLDLRYHVTPRLLRKQPIHNWFVFPHSFSPQLIDEILRQYPIRKGGKIIDPFVGAGTTMLRAKELGYSAAGTDLSILSICASSAKIENYQTATLIKSLLHITNGTTSDQTDISVLPERLRKAFTEKELNAIWNIRQKTQELPKHQRAFFLVALLNIQHRLSRAVPDGGWFRWVEKDDQSIRVPDLFKQQVQQQINDLSAYHINKTGSYQVIKKDAREMNTLGETFDALITSPPYPNRHDYSRIFHMELLSLGATEKDIFKFRYRSIRSHVEARAPKFDKTIEYESPKLENTITSIPKSADSRIVPMLKGYFDDMYLCLQAAYESLGAGAPAVFVVGNVRHGGVMVCVDEILAEIGNQVGFTFEKGMVARLRGNSAQQMGEYGREPSRETIVIFKKV